MAMAFFRQHFTRSEPLAMAGGQIFEQAIELALQPDITQDCSDTLHNVAALTNKQQHTSVAFCGTGDFCKYYAVTLLSKHTGLAVCYIHCPQWVERYAHDSGKKLARLFADAQNKHWLLFFDEADALFNPMQHAEDDEPYVPVSPGLLRKLMQNLASLVVLSVHDKNINDSFAKLCQRQMIFN
ncbi:AAA family ATPase [Neptunicella marina]|uniref:AAA family ATPase n=1 Tax=Neptunicella marina TaxID=2125989 RepID=A0A8J6LWE8_9ALTE|nr:AAA family ATPase [Neptunicella marina]MBC3765174.1 AAA family ATPase [Neptunicella marina]